MIDQRTSELVVACRLNHCLHEAQGHGHQAQPKAERDRVRQRELGRLMVATVQGRSVVGVEISPAALLRLEVVLIPLGPSCVL